jgi:hypothetical protein
VRAWPRFYWIVGLAFGVCVFLACVAFRDSALLATQALMFLACMVVLCVMHDCGTATHAIHRGLALCHLYDDGAESMKAFVPKRERV